MEQLTAGTLSAVQYAADHPRCTTIDLQNHILEGADVEGAQAHIAAAIRANLIWAGATVDPVRWMVTAKGFRAIGRA
jgi:hypothetical protein